MHILGRLQLSWRGDTRCQCHVLRVIMILQRRCDPTRIARGRAIAVLAMLHIVNSFLHVFPLQPPKSIISACDKNSNNFLSVGLVVGVECERKGTHCPCSRVGILRIPTRRYDVAVHVLYREEGGREREKCNSMSLHLRKIQRVSKTQNQFDHFTNYVVLHERRGMQC